MRGRALLVFWLTAVLCAGAANASLEVETVQSPAWLERAQQRTPLMVGDRLSRGDRVISGSGARVVLKTGAGGRIQLGERARFEVRTLFAGDAVTTTYRGVFAVLAGAFRYTTAELPRTAKRDLRFRVGSVTARVRSADIWGYSAPDSDLVCLIDGRVAVAADRDPGQPVELTRASSVYRRSKAGVVDPIALVDAPRLQQWASETEPVAGAGVTSATGRWWAHVAATDSRERAVSIRARLRDAGYPVELQRIELGAGFRWRVLVPGLGSAADASALGERISAEFGLGRAWISRH